MTSWNKMWKIPPNDFILTLEKITPPHKSITDSPSSADTQKDFSEAVGASLDSNENHVTGRVSVTKPEYLVEEAEVVDGFAGCEKTSNFKEEEKLMTMNFEKLNSYVLRIDTEQPADGVYVAACVAVESDDEDEHQVMVVEKITTVDKIRSETHAEKLVEADRLEEDPPMATTISQDKPTNGCMSNGHHEDSDEVLSTSSASEVDSLELNKSVSQQAAFFKSLTDITSNGSENQAEESSVKKTNETVIEREIRLQKEREEAVAEERRKAQMAINGQQQNGHEIINTADNHVIESCENELNGLDSLEENDVIPVPKKSVKVRPVVEDDQNDGPVYQILKETPVEREIRLTLEREAQLKRDKGIMDPNQLPEMKSEEISNSPEPPNDQSKSNSNFPSIKSRTLDLLNPKSERNLQRKLATSRIQQEIEEQTQRELALRAVGAIKNTSEDFVDGWVLGRLNSSEGTQLSGDGITEISSAVSPPSLPSTPDSELTDCTFGSPATTPSPVGSNEKPLSSSGSGSSKTNGVRLFLKKPNGVSSLPRPAGVKGVMQKFISSRGKILPPTANRNRLNSAGSFEGNDLFGNEQLIHEVRKPVPKNFRRTHCSVESKIQAELQQMKVREEELRVVRKKMALSQPNLTNIGLDDDDDNNHIADEIDKRQFNNFKEFARANSNPNLLDESSEENVKTTRGARRRTPLIDQWEKLAKQSMDN